MTKASLIRTLAADGLTTSQIAKQAEVTYQHAYNVLKRSGIVVAHSKAGSAQPITATSKPMLTVAYLLEGGFRRVCTWAASDGALGLDPALPRERGVYAFGRGVQVLYVGLATKGVLHRFRSYRRPGKSQKTSLRLNAALLEAVGAGETIDIYVAHPPDLHWNGMPVSGDAGLELGLIEAFDLPWNIRGAR